MKKILITGAGGGLGSVLANTLEKQYHVVATEADTLDVTLWETVDKITGEIAPDMIIHCAAIVNADQAQRDKMQTWRVNVEGTENIAKACKKLNAEMVFFSSDYVFNGELDRPYDEDDLVDPIQYYGITKVVGEQIVRDFVPNHYIVRISWLFGPSGYTFLQKMLSKVNEPTIKVVNDQTGSPTYTPHLSRAIEQLIQTGQYGTYHLSSEGYCSWADYASEIMRLTDSSAKVIGVNSNEYVTLAKRPRNSRLSKEKIYRLGVLRMPTWQDALKECLSNRGESK